MYNFRGTGSKCLVLDFASKYQYGGIMKKILIVDDEQLTLDGLERILNKMSGLMVVSKLQNGLQAKRYLEEHSVDIVFTDIRMPVMDGLELAKWVHIFRPECNIILISAYKDFGYAQQAMSLGVKYYLTKPFRYPEVKKVVEQILFIVSL